MHTYRKEAKNSLNLLTTDKHHILTIHQRSNPSSMTQNSLQNFNNNHNNVHYVITTVTQLLIWDHGVLPARLPPGRCAIRAFAERWYLI